MSHVQIHSRGKDWQRPFDPGVGDLCWSRPWSTLPPRPPPADALQVVHIASPAAALAKLNVKIIIEDLIKVIRDEDEAKRVKVTLKRPNVALCCLNVSQPPTPCPLSDNEPG